MCPEDNPFYSYLDNLNRKLEEDNFYNHHVLTDVMIGLISTVPNPRARRKQFINAIGSNKFKIGLFKYRRAGGIIDWVVVFKVPKTVKAGDDALMSKYGSLCVDAPKRLQNKEVKANIAGLKAATGSSSVTLTAFMLWRQYWRHFWGSFFYGGISSSKIGLIAPY
jgi:hypothetical protein